MRKILGIALVAVGVCAVAGCEFSLRTGTAVTPVVTPVAVDAGAVATLKPKGYARRKLPVRINPAISSSGGTTTVVADAGAGGSSSSGGSVPPEPPVVAGSTAFGDNVADAESFMGNIYFLPAETKALPDFTKLSPSGTLFTKTFNVQDRDFTLGFPGVDARSEFFGIVYDGPLSVSKEAVYELRLVSDDGARILIDDMPIVTNDGIHTVKEVKGPVRLLTGIHAFRVEYFQSVKPRVALQVFISSPELNMAERLLTTTL